MLVWKIWANTVAKQTMRSVQLHRLAHSLFTVSGSRRIFHLLPLVVLLISYDDESFLFFCKHLAPPTFTIRPKTQLVELGREAIFECQANGFPKPTTFWSIEGNRTLMFPGFKHDRIDVTLTPEGRTLLSIQNIQRIDAGKIIVCSAVNGVGSTSTRVVLTINTQEERPPPIIVQGPANQTLPIKSLASLPCRTMGGPIVTIAWYKDGIPLVLNDRMNLTQSGTLSIADLSKDEDAGLYTCVASTRSGKSTWSAYLKLEAPTNPNIRFYRAPEASTFPGQPGLLSTLPYINSLNLCISFSTLERLSVSSLACVRRRTYVFD